MSDQRLSGSSALSLSVVKDLEKVFDRFEDAWKAVGATIERPRIEDYLGAVAEAERSELLTELVHLDIYYRRLHGEDPKPAEYRTRFPDLKPDRLAEALASHAPGGPDRALASMSGSHPSGETARDHTLSPGGPFCIAISSADIRGPGSLRS